MIDQQAISFNVKVLLGRASLSKEEFASLQKGDILLLDQSLPNPLHVEIGQNGSLKAYAGTKEGMKAIKVKNL